MKSDRNPALLLIAAPLVTVLIMAIHPTGRDLAMDYERVARVNHFVHGTAMLALPLVFLGLLGLSRRLRHADLAVAGLVGYGVAVVSWMIAGVASGYLQTELLGELRDVAPPDEAMYLALGHYTWWVNQAFAAVGVVASSLAIALFSAAMLRRRGAWRYLGLAGLLGMVLLLLFRAGGALDLDVQGFGIIVGFQTGWLVAAGIALWVGATPRH
jgi:hypothetical protein